LVFPLSSMLYGHWRIFRLWPMGIKRPHTAVSVFGTASNSTWILFVSASVDELRVEERASCARIMI
jgi:hypothetical protein